MNNEIILTASYIRYLFTLKKFDDNSGFKGSDIAKELKYSKVSVHNMMNTFVSLNFIQREVSGRFHLTQSGKDIIDSLEVYYSKVKNQLFPAIENNENVDLAIYALLAELSKSNIGLLD